MPAVRIPLHSTDAALVVDEPYVLVTPTYGGGQGRGEEKGAVPKQVIRFLNDEDNRSLHPRSHLRRQHQFRRVLLPRRRHHQPQVPCAALVSARTVRHAGRRGSRERRIGTMVEAALKDSELQDRVAVRGDGLPLAQRDAEPVRRGRQDPVRRRPRGGAGVLPAARQPEHGVLPLPQGASRLPRREGVLRARRARAVPASSSSSKLNDLRVLARSSASRPSSARSSTTRATR